jgi:hypothetical protein
MFLVDVDVNVMLMLILLTCCSHVTMFEVSPEVHEMRCLKNLILTSTTTLEPPGYSKPEPRVLHFMNVVKKELNMVLFEQ